MVQIMMGSMSLLPGLMVFLYVSIAPISLMGWALDISAIGLGLGATWLGCRSISPTSAMNIHHLKRVIASLRLRETSGRALLTTLPATAISKDPDGIIVNENRNGADQHGLDTTRVDKRFTIQLNPIQDTRGFIVDLPELTDRISGYGYGDANVIQHIADLEILNRVVDLTTGIQDLTAVLQYVTEVVTDRFDASGMYILIPGEGKDSAAVLHGFDRWQGPIQPIPVKYPFGIKAALAQGNYLHGKPVVVTPLASPLIPAYVQKHMMGANIQNAWMLPLRIHREVKGIAFICPGSAKAQLNVGDAKFVEAVAIHTAAAIENACMVENAKEKAIYEERERLAREMHDTVAQTIYSACLITEVFPYIWDHNPEEGKQNLNKLQHLIRGALAEIRTVIFELRPSALEMASLETLLRQLGFVLSGRARIQVQMSIEGEIPLPVHVKTTIYRIAQEIFNNIAKHSEATEVQMVLKMRPVGLILNISDNGKGFQPSQGSSQGLGLRIMQERAAMIGARMEIKSEPAQGTNIKVTWSKDAAEVKERMDDVIRLMIVDDHQMVRDGLRVFLSVYNDINIVAEAGDGKQAIDLCVHVQPDVILMDILLPEIDGPTATRRIREDFPHIQIIALSNFVDEDLVQKAIRSGAIGYLLKDVHADQLVSAIRDAHKGRATISSIAATALINASLQPIPLTGSLTDKEDEVLNLLVEGKTNKEIAEQFSLSPGTVRFHVSNILSKMGVSNRTEAVSLALQHGLTKRL
jgi:DNA-binding NarL/FixJ family response regulator/signal transduction histidine kinase